MTLSLTRKQVPMSKPERIPAYPETCNGQIFQGPDLRDWFAGQAISAQFIGLAIAGYANFNDVQIQRVADAAYAVADAMLAERSK